MIGIKRVYDAASESDGARFLIERIWPRGIKKDALQIDAWLKDVAPSTELRRWFAHDPRKWDEFRRRYFAELDRRPQSWRDLLDDARNGRVTLVYSARDLQHNSAVALREYLQSKARHGRSAA